MRKIRRVKVYLNGRRIGRVKVEKGTSPFKEGSGEWRSFAREYHVKAQIDGSVTSLSTCEMGMGFDMGKSFALLNDAILQNYGLTMDQPLKHISVNIVRATCQRSRND